MVLGVGSQCEFSPTPTLGEATELEAVEVVVGVAKSDRISGEGCFYAVLNSSQPGLRKRSLHQQEFIGEMSCFPGFSVLVTPSVFLVTSKDLAQSRPLITTPLRRV
jgi:hypothetical protein